MVFCASGSPPRMREIPLVFSQSILMEGITPAYAGNTRYGINEPPNYGDHPRVCGKYLTRILSPVSSKGSPPRMREIQKARVASGELIGITPAYAGNTEFNFRAAMLFEDHPRVCGKY